jgi:hypothetical protein
MICKRRRDQTFAASRLKFHLVGDNMAGESTRSRRRRRLSGGGADYVALGLIAAAAIALAALALSGVSLRSGTNPTPTPRPASTVFDLPAQTATPTPAPQPPAALSLLSNQPIGATTSWWGLSVTAALVPGVVESFELAPSASGDTSALAVSDLQDRVNAAPSLTGYVVIQAGAEDLNDGALPSVVATEVQALWQAVATKGATPVVALVSPSDENGAEVIELNGLLQTAAATAGLGVLDLYSPVAAPNGSWETTFSDDGAAPNTAGSEALAQSAIAQLPPLTATK